MIPATLKLTKAQLTEAVAEWLERHGVPTTNNFSVAVKTTPGDRPFDPEYTEITCAGVLMPIKEAVK